MSRGPRIVREEFEYIKLQLDKGRTVKDIEQMTGRSEKTIINARECASWEDWLEMCRRVNLERQEGRAARAKETALEELPEPPKIGLDLTPLKGQISIFEMPVLPGIEEQILAELKLITELVRGLACRQEGRA